ncbi:peptidoglycan-binding domain-containing protein [Magnetovibrio sp. PR-2]|uniref:peptidoglycan-binding domain-containing protein n=1 Tax=Magnetovibrio sp. PR-2 TaxID=3120356 RepID=UPI002FCE2EFD
MTHSPKLSPNAHANPQDVVAAKLLLRQLGHYEAPDWGISEYPDRDLFDAIKDFQSKQGLKVDGVINAEGETVKAMAQHLQYKGRNGDTILAHITPAEAELLHRVTDGGSINPETGLPEFFIGSALGAMAGSFFGPVAGSAVGSLAGKYVGDYAARKISEKVGGPVGQILGGTVGGFLGNGSYTDISGGLKNAFTGAVGNYAAGKVCDTIGGPLGSTLGNALGSSLQSGLSDTIDAMGPKTSGKTGGISGALSDQFATKDTTSFGTPGINGQADGGVGRSTPKRTQPNNALGTPRQTSSLSNASLAPKVPKSKTNPVLQGPEGPMQDPLTGRYLRVNDFKPIKQPKPKRQISTFSDATRQRVKSAQAAATKPSRVQEVWSGPKAQTKEISNTPRPHVYRTQNTKHAQTMELKAPKAEPRVQEVWSGPKAHLNKPKDTQDTIRAEQDKYQNKLHTNNASASPAPQKGRTLSDPERKRARHGVKSDKSMLERLNENELFRDATRWHYEGREKRNTPLPENAVEAVKSGFAKYPDWQNEEHQNGIGKPEVKYAHPDGREVVYDGDTGKLITNPDLAGSYNYVTAPPFDPNDWQVDDLDDLVIYGAGHMFTDWFPYKIFQGNHRKK